MNSINNQKYYRYISIFIGYIAWPLALKCNISLYTLLNSLRPGGRGVDEKRLWGLTHIDRVWRGYYRNLAQDIIDLGPGGYVWGHGFGCSLAGRPFNTAITYRLLHWLGFRHLLFVSYLVLLAILFGVLLLHFNPITAVALAVLFGGSPLVTRAYFERGKPEIIWYNLALWIVFIAGVGAPAAAGIGWSLLMLVNIPTAIMLALVAGPGLLTDAIASGGGADLLWGAAPGGVLMGVALRNLVRHGQSAAVSSTLRALYRSPLTPRADEVFVAVTFAAAILLSQPTAGGMIIALSGGLLYYQNWRFHYINDIQSFDMVLFATAFGVAAAAGASWGLAASALLAYRYRPQSAVFGFAIDDRRRLIADPSAGWPAVWRSLCDEYTGFPAIPLYTLPRSPALLDAVAALSGRSRIILETPAGEAANAFPSRALRGWLDVVLPPRGIENLSDDYAFTYHPDFARQVLARFNSTHMDGATAARTMAALGARYILAFTPAMAACLQETGDFRVIAALRGDDVAINDRSKLGLKDHDLFFIEMITPASEIITPSCRWTLQGEKIIIEGEKGVAYVMRYRFDPHIRGFQNDANGKPQEIIITPAITDPNIPITFMRIVPSYDGPVEISYVK